MAADVKQIYTDMMAAVGGEENVSTLGNCMTRIRFTLKDDAKAQGAKLRKIPGVAGYVFSGGQHQIIVGPGTAAKLGAYAKEQYNFAPLSMQGVEDKKVVGDAKGNKAITKQKYSSNLSRICARIGAIFVPLIPAYIGCGLLLGFANIAKSINGCPADLVTFLTIMGQGVFFYLNAAVGWNTAKEFGGTPALGLALAGALNYPGLANLHWFGQTFVPGRGGIIAVLFVCYLACFVEKFFRARVKNTLEIFTTPTLTLLVMGLASLIVIQPIAGYLSDLITKGVQYGLHRGGLIFGGILGGCFLPTVMLGIHQSLVPIHQQLVDTLGNNPLFPILSMAGAGQVGAGIAVYFMTKNKNLKNITKGALPVGILGIGEPLIYGVTLPLFKPFIAACLGGAVGGAIGAVAGVTSAIAFGVSGVVLLLALSGWHSIIFYAVGFACAIAAGALFTWLLGFDDPVEEE